MRYNHESAPYEHTCPNCGRHQEVFEYSRDPEFDVGEVSGTGVVECEMVVNLNTHFECIACQHSVEFDGAMVHTGKQVRVTFHAGERAGKRMDIHHVRRIAIQQFKQEHDVEDFLDG
jgi:hypothetical protein